MVGQTRYCFKHRTDVQRVWVWIQISWRRIHWSGTRARATVTASKKKTREPRETMSRHDRRQCQSIVNYTELFSHARWDIAKHQCSCAPRAGVSWYAFTFAYVVCVDVVVELRLKVMLWLCLRLNVMLWLCFRLNLRLRFWLRLWL